MRDISPGCHSAVQAAKDLLAELTIESPDEIDVELIAAHCGAHVRFRPLRTEEGHLIRAGDNAIIVVNAEAKSSNRWRFVVGHELGHLFRHRTLNQLRLCTDPDLHSWYETSGHEPEANYFAAELLMPEVLFAPRCDLNAPSLHDVRRIASAFNTSLQATALRLVDFCPEPVAVAHSADGAIDWWSANADFKFFLKRGYRLTTRTCAGDIFAGKPADDRPTAIDGDAWSDDTRAADVEVREHSLSLGEHGVLTLLWHPYE